MHGSYLRFVAMAWSLLVAATGAGAIDTQSLRELGIKLEPTLATVVVEAAGGQIRTGTGFFASADGRLITSYRLVAGAAKGAVVLSGDRLMDIEGYVASDMGVDLVVLRVSGVAAAPLFIEMAPAAPLLEDDVALFAGPVHSLCGVTPGKIKRILTGNQVAQLVSLEAYRAGDFDEQTTWLQTSTFITAFHRGGPLVTAGGELVGVAAREAFPGLNLNLFVDRETIGRLLQQPPHDPLPIKSLRAPRTVAATKTEDEGNHLLSATSRLRARPMVVRFQTFDDSRQLLIDHTVAIREQSQSLEQAANDFKRRYLQTQQSFLKARGSHDRILRNPSGRRKETVDRGEKGEKEITVEFHTAEDLARMNQLAIEIRYLQGLGTILQAEGGSLLAEHRSLQVNAKTAKARAEEPITNLVALADVSGSRDLQDAQHAALLLSSWQTDEAYRDVAKVVVGILLHRQGQHAAAAAELRAVIDKPGSKATNLARASLGRLLVTSGQVAEGREQLQLAKPAAAKEPYVAWIVALSDAALENYTVAASALAAAKTQGADPIETQRLLALIHATCPDEKVRDSGKATRYAKAACEATEQSDWACLLALAAAYAEGKQFDRAAQIAKQAEDLAPQADQEQCRRHRTLYEANQPLRLTWRSGFQDR